MGKYEVYLLYEESEHGGEICQGDEDSKWPYHEPLYIDFVPKAIRLKEAKWCETVEVDFDPKGCSWLYIVIVRYQSGSTFGLSHGNWKIVGAYRQYDDAERVADLIEDGSYKGYKVWEGYFERLESVDVVRVDVWAYDYEKEDLYGDNSYC